MRILLDTHVFLWFVAGSRKLPAKLRHAIRDPANEVFLSVVSVWEASIKHATGKLPLPDAPEIYLPTQRQKHRLESLPIDEGSVVELARLSHLHRDPFDRMLVAQAIQHGLSLATVDPILKQYPVSIMAG